VTSDDATARWACRPIDLGGANQFTPLVLGPAGVPEITDVEQARNDPELAVLSAMAHGLDADIGKSVQIAMAAQQASLGLDEDRLKLYFDLVFNALSEAARRELRTMDPAKYEYQSDFARGYLAQGRAEGTARGRAEGEVSGRAALVTKQLVRRFGPLTDATTTLVASASIEQLDAIGEQLLTAQTLEEALDSH
jgi:hypothetical protein